ncbi:MAG: YihY/virulence factor BrkB family protein [Pirellulales bacterium]
MKKWLANLFPNIRDAAIRWTEDDASSLAASVAYYLALSLFPLMLLLFSGLGLFLQFTNLGKNAEQQFLSAVSTYGSPLIEKLLQDVLVQLRAHSVVSCPSGFAAAVAAAIGVFCALDRGLDRIYRVPTRKSKTLTGTIRNLVRDRFWAFFMLLSLGGMIALLFVANMVFAQVRSMAGTTLPAFLYLMGLFDLCCTIAANTLLFTLAYRWLPRKFVGWTEAFRGGLLAAGIWELGRWVLGMFLIGMRYTTAYGAIGSFIAILLWFYYAVSIFYFGAEYVQVIQAKRRKARGEPEVDESLRTLNWDTVKVKAQSTIQLAQAIPFWSEALETVQGGLFSYDDQPTRESPSVSSAGGDPPRVRPRRTSERRAA